MIKVNIFLTCLLHLHALELRLCTNILRLGSARNVKSQQYRITAAHPINPQNLTAHKLSCGKVMFLHVSVCSQGGMMSLPV